MLTTVQLQRRQNASVIEQRCADLSPHSADRNHQFTPDPWRPSSPLCAGLGIRYTHRSSVALVFGGRLERVSSLVRLLGVQRKVPSVENIVGLGQHR